MIDCLPYVLTRTVDPAHEPITATECKLQLNLEPTDKDFDAWLEPGDSQVGVIRAAREMVEADTQLALIDQTWTLKLDQWPEDDRTIDLRIHPVRSISSVTYKDTTGTTQTWGASNYEVLRHRFRSYLLKPDTTTVWPTLSSTLANPITITFIAGYSDPSTDTTAIAKRNKVPAAAKKAMLMLISHWFRQREAVLIGSISKEIELGYRSLINTIRPNRYL